MPTRSPILRGLLRASRSATAERAASPPPPLGRRQFVGGALAAGMTAACASRPRPRTRAPDDVMIIGAGLAGVVCAYRLHQHGVPVTLYEASDRIGGRVFSDTQSFPDRQVVELGGELIDSSHRTLIRLCRELGLVLDDLKADTTNLASTFWLGNREVPEDELAAMLRPVVQRMRRDVAAMRPAPVPNRTVPYRTSPYGSGGRFHELDQWSIARWLDDARVESPARELIAIAFTTEFGLEPDQLSCVPMLSMLSVDGDAIELYGESDERYHVRGGNQQIATQLAARLSDRIETGTSLEALARRPDGRLVASLVRDARHFEVVTQRLVLALPFSTLRRVFLHRNLGLSERKRKSIHELGYGTNAKLVLGFSSRPWRDLGKDGEVFSTLPFQTTWDASRAQPGASGILVNFTGGAHGLELGQGDALVHGERAVQDLERVFPGARARFNSKTARFHWPSHPDARGSYSTWLVGQLSTFGGVEGETEGKNLHFAGEHTSLVAAGYMEGAAESGERVAAEILAGAAVDDARLRVETAQPRDA